MALASTSIWGRLLGASDVRLCGSNHYVDTWPGDVQRSASETPNALAFSATASPLNVVALCAKVIKGLKARSAVKHIASIDVLFLFIVRSPLVVDSRLVHATVCGGQGTATHAIGGHLRMIRLQALGCKLHMHKQGLV